MRRLSVAQPIQGVILTPIRCLRQYPSSLYMSAIEYMPPSYCGFFITFAFHKSQARAGSPGSRSRNAPSPGER